MMRFVVAVLCFTVVGPVFALEPIKIKIMHQWTSVRDEHRINFENGEAADIDAWKVLSVVPVSGAVKNLRPALVPMTESAADALTLLTKKEPKPKDGEPTANRTPIYYSCTARGMLTIVGQAGAATLSQFNLYSLANNCVIAEKDDNDE